jgi:hypothetical protein
MAVIGVAVSMCVVGDVVGCSFLDLADTEISGAIPDKFSLFRGLQ